MISYVEFVLSLFVPLLFLSSPSFGTSGGLCFVNVAFLEYLHLYIYIYFFFFFFSENGSAVKKK